MEPNRTGGSHSRRYVLQSLAVASTAGVAGCLGEDSGDSESIGCSSFEFSNERSPPLVAASVAPVEGSFEYAQLEIVLNRAELQETNAAVVNVYNPYDEDRSPEYTIPVVESGGTSKNVSRSGEEVTKRTTVGRVPVTGVLRVVVEDEDGGEIATERFSFECE